jgi:ABC-type lipoprotein export system ATPase subunit
MMTETNVGARWSIWDLHVHTPASLVHHFGGSDDKTWERYIDELEAIPPEVKVIGVNDYWFLDGYRRVVGARESGRLTNLDAVFPVVEMRTNQFGGTDGHLRRVNLHVIFDPALGVDVIEQQFLGRLSGEFALNSSSNVASWGGAVTRDSLRDLGKQIKASVPADRIHEYGSDLIEGFNNLAVPMEKVLDLLDSTYLRDRALVGLGKAEWSQIKWNDQSIAVKKDLVNRASLIFTAFQQTKDWAGQVQQLKDSNVQFRLLDCSDAHHFSNSQENERLGACRTWMNTTPTFAGLKHALREFDHRVFVGLQPPPLERIATHPEQFVAEVRISSTDSRKHRAFNYAVPINSGFVAVVGNKGQGKSALLDCIALAGNSTRNSEFAFLNPKRFLSASNRSAKEYSAAVVWATGEHRSVSITEGHDPKSPTAIEYLPQRFVERVCTADPLSEDAEDFERELRAVLFTHIPEEERAKERTFDALLASRSAEAHASILRLRADLAPLIAAYDSASDFYASNAHEDVEQLLERKRAQIAEAELAVAEAARELHSLETSGTDDPEQVKLRERAEHLRDEVKKFRQSLQGSESEVAAIDRAQLQMNALLKRADSVATEIDQLNADFARILGTEGAQLVTYEIGRDLVESWQRQRRDQLSTEASLRSGLQDKIQSLETDLREVEGALAARDGARELARQKVRQNERRVADLRGNEDDPESELGLVATLEAIVRAPARLEASRSLLVDKSLEIFVGLQDQLEVVRRLYQPASDFIQRSDVVSKAGLQFNAELRVLPTWQSLAADVDARRSPELGPWILDLRNRLAEVTSAAVAEEIDGIIRRMEGERGVRGSAFRSPATTLRSSTTLSDYLERLLSLSWLEVRFGLTGDGLPLSQLSPGQRGLILALFYLVVDQRTTPLLLDQPEENLDNETIATHLVPAIRQAAGRRQTIVVTHNANLAIVGDADQILHCEHSDGVFSVSAGSISEFDTASYVVDVLEGTMPAFANRRQTYEAFPELAV